MKFKTWFILFCSVFFLILLSLVFIAPTPLFASSIKIDSGSSSQILDKPHEPQKNLISPSNSSIQAQNSATTLVGNWYNELGSTLTIDVVRNGAILGSYQTAVSSSSCAQGSFPLAGRTSVDSGRRSVGFVVSWKNASSDCGSITAWSGQLQNNNGEDNLVTAWLLAVETDPSNNWRSTTVGKDTFKRSRYVN